MLVNANLSGNHFVTRRVSLGLIPFQPERLACFPKVSLNLSQEITIKIRLVQFVFVA